MIPELKPKQAKRLGSIKKVYDLQAVAKNVLNKVITEKYQTVNNKTGAIYHRAMICQSIPNYYAQRNGLGQGITISKEGKAAFYGVGSCGMGWTCPVCARKLCHQRKLEIDQGMIAIREKGWTALMVTFTHSHSIEEKLADKMKRKSAALRFMKGHRDFVELKKTIGYVGQIRALEVTHGNSGWHPHTHEMWILDRKITIDQVASIKKAAYKLWRTACIEKGLGEPSEAHGVDVSFNVGDETDAGMIGSYLAKFGFELTNSQGKKASNAGRNAWQILESLKAKFNKPDAELFREYSEAMYGKAIVFWSRGLKTLLGVNADEPDDLIADDLFSDPIGRVEFSNEDWGLVRELRLHAYVLRQAELGVILKQQRRVEKWLDIQKRKMVKLGKHGYLISRRTRFKYSHEPDALAELAEQQRLESEKLPKGFAPSMSWGIHDVKSLVLGCRFLINVIRERGE